MSVRLRLTLSYTAAIILTGAGLLTVVWLFLLRYVPTGAASVAYPDGRTWAPSRGDLIRAFVPPTVAIFVLLVAVGVLGGWFLAGQMLRPLGRLHNAAQRASEGSLSHRVALEGRGDEFRDLADVFDHMLEQLERHVGEQQRFAANASHELRTPLAITRALLDNAETDPTIDRTELIAQLSELNTREVALVEALLLLSRSENAVIAREPVDLSLCAEDAVETLEPLAARRGICVEAKGSPVIVNGSASLLHQLTSNLVHNAIVHNLPEHGTVSVCTRERGGFAELVVENTGATLDAAQLATLTEPFQRGQRTTSHGSGVGLGLAIAASIVRAHRGRLTLIPRDGGGLSAAVVLPR